MPFGLADKGNLEHHIMTETELVFLVYNKSCLLIAIYFENLSYAASYCACYSLLAGHSAKHQPKAGGGASPQMVELLVIFNRVKMRHSTG